MKKYIYTVMLILVGITVAQAQRMLPKQRGLEISTGILSNDKIGNDYYISALMTVNRKNGNYQLWALEYTHQYHEYKDLRIPQETYCAEGGYSFFLLGDARKNITLNLGITGVVGYESINHGDTMLYDGSKILSEDNFIYGAGGRLTFETYLSDRFVLVLQGRTKVLWGTDLEQFRPSAGVGLRFNF
ncbi:conjugal transfer protein TraO [Chitinophaga sancti]|uniref:Conjugal transfer protein TraO n=1 Tax=Chitinophaga sancti TaxID=1004 RepID=A0A1K1R599_9BACT|nr:conjugal transfer protein TraO [Chitinophaga sancti]WQD64230.1 conjugal transfer protein TraO [Chitinophaga sancti]WQG90146.1 conjugal transfer protein TraO [Chitinophaga sancti]SFW67280.1 Conjugative transposon protein TraO [Chitinophaga sancti]